MGMLLNELEREFKTAVWRGLVNILISPDELLATRSCSEGAKEDVVTR